MHVGASQGTEGEFEMAQANEMTGGEAMARMLQAFKSGPMFGMGGFQLLAFYDAARRLKLDHHLINDERCGAFAADAYAKVSGRVGLVDATLGPGATNLATGLIEALNAGTPVVAFIGDTNRMHAGKNMTQEARQVEILRPACKELLRIEEAARIPELIRRAFQVATSGRPTRRSSRSMRATRRLPPSAAGRRPTTPPAPPGCWPRPSAPSCCAGAACTSRRPRTS